MLPVSRLGDMGVGYCTDHDGHDATGFIITSQSTVLINGLPCAKMGDIVLSTCGSSGIIVGGSSKAMLSGLPMATMSTSFVGTFSGILVNGSNNVLC